MQQDFLKEENRKFKKPYGGALFNTRKGRSYGRPLDSKRSIHLVLRSSKAIGEWSFSNKENAPKIKAIVNKFAAKYGVRILSFANVGNHLHFHIKLAKRQSYRPFIRAITAAIAMAVTGVSRWRSYKDVRAEKFWDQRPFTRIVSGLRHYLTLKDYIELNQLEGFGFTRGQAKMFMAGEKFAKLSVRGFD